MTSVGVNSYEMPLIPSGKYAGQPATVLFDDISQMEWLKSQPWFDKSPKWKPVYNLIVHQSLVQPGADSKTPEHNQLQNIFFDPNIQRRLIKRMFRHHLDGMLVNINNLIKDTEFIDIFGTNPEYTIDELLKYESAHVQAESKFNWDICMSFGNSKLSFSICEELEKKYKNAYLKKNNLEKYEEEQRIIYENAKTEYEKKISEVDEMSKTKLDELSKINTTDIRGLFGKGLKQSGVETVTIYDKKYWDDKKYWAKMDFEKCEKQYKTNMIVLNNTYNQYKKKYVYDLVMKHLKSSAYYNIEQEGLLTLDVYIFSKSHSILCELKPSLGDDYPCVIRKMRAQIETTLKQDEINRKSSEYKYAITKKCFMLILGRFSAKYTDIALLRQKFDPKTITILFTDELLDDLPKAPTIENTGNCASTVVKESTPDISVLLTEVSLLKSQLADAQGIIAKTQQENDALKEQIAKLQKPTTKKPAQKDAKSITEYFKK
jgi:hypothetical protein